MLEAGSFPGGANLVSSDTQNPATSFTAAGVGAGTYLVRIRATKCLRHHERRVERSCDRRRSLTTGPCLPAARLAPLAPKTRPLSSAARLLRLVLHVSPGVSIEARRRANHRREETSAAVVRAARD